MRAQQQKMNKKEMDPKMSHKGSNSLLNLNFINSIGEWSNICAPIIDFLHYHIISNSVIKHYEATFDKILL
jgi:hypothetical protein